MQWPTFLAFNRLTFWLNRILVLVLVGFCSILVQAQSLEDPLEKYPQKKGYVPGSFRFREYQKDIQGKRIGLVINHTSRFRGKMLLDTLIAQGHKIGKIFAPEHGYAGSAEAGQTVHSGMEPRFQIPILSLYGKKKKPDADDLKDIDIVLVDLQDVGARFYTYLSTLKNMMEACAEFHIPILVLDRANPLGFCVAGPLLEPEFKSFVGVFPIPIVHGMTLGELAQMSLKEGWLEKGESLNLKVIPCAGYRHRDTIFPEVRPSPNLTTPLSILAYPSLCLFEGTPVSVGRGTLQPFQQFGIPDPQFGPHRFTPIPLLKDGPAPLYSGKECFGFRLNADSIKSCFDLRFVRLALGRFPNKTEFFMPFFDKLAGNASLKQDLLANRNPIFKLENFLKSRKRYLLYPD